MRDLNHLNHAMLTFLLGKWTILFQYSSVLKSPAGGNSCSAEYLTMFYLSQLRLQNQSINKEENWGHLLLWFCIIQVKSCNRAHSSA